MTVTPITLGDLTSGTLEGTGVFDALMRSAKVHLEDQFNQDRIRGTDYATVYLGQLESSMQTALAFLTSRDKLTLEGKLLEQQVLLAQIEVLKANIQLEILAEQKLTAVVERQVMSANLAKIQAETLLIPKQGLLLDSQIELSAAEIIQKEAENANLLKQGELIDAQILLANNDVTKSAAEIELVNANVAKVEAETLNVPKQGLLIEAQTALSTQEKANSIIQGTVLVAQECKLRAEFDYTMQNVLKSGAEVTLLNQKLNTEKAQTLALGVDPDSVIGRQKELYLAQRDGFKRDAEQKAASILTATWNTRRMSDDGVVADTVNKLDDATIGRAVTKMLEGVGA